MNLTTQQILHEAWADFLTPASFWQIAMIVVACVTAWAVNGALRTYVRKHTENIMSTQANADAAVHAINRVLFPLTALLIVWGAIVLLASTQHTSLLHLASQLLLAMAAIRLAVYVLRYVFSPSGWVKATENAIATTIWTILALHLSGLLPELVALLDGINVTLGKSKVTLLLVIQALFTVVVTVVVALWLSRLIENRLMQNTHLNPNMRVVLGKVLRIVLTVFAVLFAFSAIGLDITLLSVFGGALGVGLGFGLQKIASNFISGFILLLDDSIHMGDVITVENHYGVVSDLRARYLVLKKLDGTEVVIPNETLIAHPVVNHSFTDHKARVQMPVQVSYDSALELAMQLIEATATKHERVLKDPAPTVHLKGFGDNGIDLMLSFWIPDPEEGSSALQSEIYLDIWRAFKNNAIVIPYPQREVRML
ncbi:MAG TPA: mechanosensitive ion channel [Methylotenera sp.]|nr:mechanosensitive ion channel [Methylotenera sp.]HPH06671.1 mechanosensitive ion channel [Methylotenera sp.]HPN01686.1 mechanosensitive ion channel [Methylotenera sp.]